MGQEQKPQGAETETPGDRKEYQGTGTEIPGDRKKYQGTGIETPWIGNRNTEQNRNPRGQKQNTGEKRIETTEEHKLIGNGTEKPEDRMGINTG